jgi:HlyD family secretion protein
MAVSRRVIVTIGVVLAPLVLATAIYSRTSALQSLAPDAGSRPGSTLAASGPPPTEVAIPVEGVVVVRGTLTTSLSAAGRAAAWRSTVITAQVSGRISGLPAREGDRVSAGQLLVSLDPAEYGLAVEEAEAARQDALWKFKELTVLDDRIPDADVRRDRDQAARARSGLGAAEIRIRRARLDLARTRSLAPFSGRIASLKVVPGQWVKQGEELMTLVELDPLKVEVEVLESEVGSVSLGNVARVTFSAFPGEVFTGRVETINPLVDTETRTARATILVPNALGRILPGMYARVSLDAQHHNNRILVPRSAVVERDRRTMVFVAEPADRGEVAKWRYVTTGLKNDSVVEILAGDGNGTDGVQPGETVLTAGHANLIHDARIRVVSKAGSVASGP